MGKEKNIPCLTLDKTGGTRIDLNAVNPTFQHPNWHCNYWECSIRLRGRAYENTPVRLGNKGRLHGVVRCGAAEQERQDELI